MAKRSAKTAAMAEAGANRPRGKAKDARLYEHPIVPIADITDAANELRIDHPKVSDDEAQLVHLIIQTGNSPAASAELLGKTKNWAYYCMSKAHVADYRQAVAVRVLGWDSAAALSTMRGLLSAKSDYIKLEAARDILDRSGLSLEPAAPRGPVVNMNFNLTAMAPVVTHEPLVVDASVMAPQAIIPSEERMGPNDLPSISKGPLKSAIEIGEGGLTHMPRVQEYDATDLE